MTSETHISFQGQEYDGAEEQLGDFAGKLSGMVKDAATAKFGEEALPDPSNIEIVPAHMGEPLFVVSAWHQEGEGDAQERKQYLDFSFKVKLDGDEAVIEADNDLSYPLTTRETLLLARVANIAYIKSQLSDARENGEA